MRLTSLLMIMFLIALAAGCPLCPGADDDDTATQEVEIGYVAWACATASSYLVKNALEQNLDISVQLSQLNAGVVWESTGSGSLDIFLAAWLPITHGQYYEEMKDQVVLVRENYDGARIGLVVPEYVVISSITELNENADAFGGRIVGIDAGAGIMDATINAIEEYDLELELQESSDAAMTAALGSAINDEEWVVVTGWTPHWKFAQWDLKFLEDPEEAYGGAETINTITRQGFAEDFPQIQGFLERYFLTEQQLGNLMGMAEEMNDPDEAAKAWIEENQDLVDSWFEDTE